MKKEIKKIETDWESLDFLKGLKGLVKPEVAALYECCKSVILSGSTK